MAIIESDAQLTDAVVEAMSRTDSPRLREVMAAFVRHLHAFAREVRLTQSELEIAIDFVNRIGQATNDLHNEGMLAADVIGLSTLVCLMDDSLDGQTESMSALLGPFWRMYSPPTENGGSIVRSPTDGSPLAVEGLVVDAEHQPLADVEVDVWQASPVGLYENQDHDQAPMNLRGKFRTDADGRFFFRSVEPAGYPVPTHGPIGELLRAQRRDPFRPAHLHFLLVKPGYQTLISQVFVGSDDRLERDVVFGVTAPLVGDFRLLDGAEAGAAEHGAGMALRRRFVMKAGASKLPIPPIR